MKSSTPSTARWRKRASAIRAHTGRCSARRTSAWPRRRSVPQTRCAPWYASCCSHLPQSRIHGSPSGTGRTPHLPPGQDAGRHRRTAPAAKGDVRRAQAPCGQQGSEYITAACAPLRAGQGQIPCGIRSEVRCLPRRKRTCPPGGGFARAIQRVRGVQERRRTLPRTHRALPCALWSTGSTEQERTTVSARSTASRCAGGGLGVPPDRTGSHGGGSPGTRSTASKSISSSAGKSAPVARRCLSPCWRRQPWQAWRCRCSSPTCSESRSRDYLCFFTWSCQKAPESSI